MPNRNKEKGTRFEHLLVKTFEKRGYPALRQPLSGSLETHPGDVLVEIKGHAYTIEAKHRKDGFKQLYGWLEKESKDFLAIKADRKEPLIVMPLSLLWGLMKE